MLVLMSTTRRGFLATAGAAATPNLGHAQDHDHDHAHQAVPSDLTLRVKALESLLVRARQGLGRSLAGLIEEGHAA
jgi:hypothetical protein